MYPAHDVICNMHRDSVSKHTPSFVTFGPSIPELKPKRPVFAPPHFARAMPQCQLRWMVVGSIHGRRDVATHQRRPFVNQTPELLLQGYKLVKSVTGSGCVVPCRAAHAQICPLFTKELRSAPRAPVIINSHMVIIGAINSGFEQWPCF